MRQRVLPIILLLMLAAAVGLGKVGEKVSKTKAANNISQSSQAKQEAPKEKPAEPTLAPERVMSGKPPADLFAEPPVSQPVLQVAMAQTTSKPKHNLASAMVLLARSYGKDKVVVWPCSPCLVSTVSPGAPMWVKTEEGFLLTNYSFAIRPQAAVTGTVTTKDNWVYFETNVQGGLGPVYLRLP